MDIINLPEDSLPFKIKNIIYYLTNDINGFNDFLKKWGLMNAIDKKYIKEALTKYCYDIIQNGDPTSITFFNSIKVLEFLDEKKEIKHPCLPLELNKKYTDKEIVKVFHRLKNKNIILDDNKTIAKALSVIFSLNENTMYSYLSRAKELKDVNDII
jgi:hypothetical protein